MRCPNCGAETSDDGWNCSSCRINLYWSSQHYEDLASIRAGQGLPEVAETPDFLREAHARAMSERPDAAVEHKVRQVARRAMGRHKQV